MFSYTGRAESLSDARLGFPAGSLRCVAKELPRRISRPARRAAMQREAADNHIPDQDFPFAFSVLDVHHAGRAEVRACAAPDAGFRRTSELGRYVPGPASSGKCYCRDPYGVLTCSNAEAALYAVVAFESNEPC